MKHVLLLLLGVLFFPTLVSATSPRDYVLEVNPSALLERFLMDDRVLTRGEGIEVLLAYFQIETLAMPRNEEGKPVRPFRDIWPAHTYGDAVYTACMLELLDCSDASRAFRGQEPMTIESFLKLYFDLVYFDKPEYLQYKYAGRSEEWYYPYVMEAKQIGLIGEERPLGTLTRSDVWYLLYKDAVLASYHYLLPKYFDGLVPDGALVTPDVFHDVQKLEEIEKEYRIMEVYIAEQKKQISAMLRAGEKLEEVGARMQDLRGRFAAVRAEVLANPLYYDPAFAAIKPQIKEFGLREIIGEGYYDFSKDPAYRKNNVRVSLDKFNGIVLQPGEEFNYWTELYKKGVDGIQNGWLIIGEKEVWGWGGGLCGTATALFRAAWFSGLEISERRAHTIYYTNLYARQDVGLDAAVYQNVPNLRFKNSTAAPLMIHVIYNDRKDIARVVILGQKHFDEISFPELRKEGRTYVRSRSITTPDGVTTKEDIRSTYRNL